MSQLDGFSAKPNLNIFDRLNVVYLMWNLDDHKTLALKLLNYPIMGYILMAYPALEIYFDLAKFNQILRGKLLESKGFMITVDKEDVEKTDRDLSQWKVVKNEVPTVK